jgi:putative transposase
MKPPRLHQENLQWLLKQPAETKIAMLENHLDICRLLINEVLEEEVIALCGERYAHHKPHNGRFQRYGYNPGSVRIGEHRLRVSVPRVIDRQNNAMKTLESYQNLQDITLDEEYLLRGIMLGLSVRDFADLSSNPSGDALKKSSINQTFIERADERVREFEARRFDTTRFVGLFVDGKYLAGEQIVLALGVTEHGIKQPLGFIQTTTENSVSIGALFRTLQERGFSSEGGLLCVLDGSKGMTKAVNEVFGDTALIQRCQWHKRENVVSYLPKSEQARYKGLLQAAYSEPLYTRALERLNEIASELRKRNRSAAQSLEEGLEETLLLHRLQMTEFSTSFATTNCIESLNAHLERTSRKVKRWMNSQQRFRWVGAGLLEAEDRMRKVNNFERLDVLKTALSHAITNPNFN